MGCDVHAFAEVRHPAAGPDGSDVWEKVGDLFDCHPHDRAWLVEEGRPLVTDVPFDSRSYRLFGWLAGVRWDPPGDPVAPHRGVPDDASPEVLAEYEAWGPDVHSATWVGLWEITDEALDAPDPHGDPWRRHFPADFLAAVTLLRTLGDRRHVRLILWFDS